MSLLLEMFTYPFILRAFVVGILVSLCAALLGVPLVLKRYSMIGDGLSHVSFGALSVASAVMSPEMLEQALLYPRQSVALDVSFKNIMSVNVPIYDFQTKTAEEGDIFPYGLAQTSGELDDAMTALSGVFEDMLELAQVEKTMQLLAQEIEKTRRRVNALEYVMIPDLQKNIKYISMKLEENENSTKVRLMKVKEMVLQDAHHYQY